VQAGAGQPRRECNGAFSCRENDTGTRVARSTCEHALQERRAGDGGGREGGGGRDTTRVRAVRVSRPANFTATEERAARAAPRGWARFHPRLPPHAHASRRGAPHPYRLPAIARASSRGLLVSSNLPRLTRRPAASAGGRSMIEGQGGREGEGGRRGGEGASRPRFRPRSPPHRDPRARSRAYGPLYAARVAARVRNHATTRGCARAQVTTRVISRRAGRAMQMKRVPCAGRAWRRANARSIEPR